MKFLHNFWIVIIFVFVSCQENGVTNIHPSKDLFIRTSTTDDFSCDCHTTLEINNRNVKFVQQNIDGTKTTKTDMLTQYDWISLLSTIDIDALSSIKMQPRCGNQLESIFLENEETTLSFGFEVGSPPNSIEAQLEGEVSSSINFILELRKIRERYQE